MSERYIRDAREAHALYDAMTTPDLEGHRAQFEADRTRASTPEAIAFCAGRLAIIDAILKGRNA
jgi:hypothetical protein